MKQMAGVSDFVAVQIFEDHKYIVLESLRSELKRLAKKEGYSVAGEITIIIAGYRKFTKKGFIPTEKELADVVEIFATAGISKEQVK